VEKRSHLADANYHKITAAEVLTGEMFKRSKERTLEINTQIKAYSCALIPTGEHPTSIFVVDAACGPC
jgi:5-deoxy-D-glucuronate isomerase